MKNECNARATSIALTNQKMGDIEKKVNSIETKLDTLIEKLDGKHASKWVENAVIWVGIMVGGLVLTAIVNNVLK